MAKILWESAIDILLEVGEPMKVKDIWNEIERRNIYDGVGKTPWRTLFSEILWRTAGANPSRKYHPVFYRHGEGKYGLLEWLTDSAREVLSPSTPNAGQGDSQQDVPQELGRSLNSAIVTFIDDIVREDRTGSKFQRLCAMALESMGFENIVETGKSGDQGIDIIATHNATAVALNIVCQCKGTGQKVQPNKVRELNGARPKGIEIHARVLFSASGFTPASAEAAEGCGIQLIDKELLASLLVSYGIKIGTDHTAVLPSSRY